MYFWVLDLVGITTPPPSRNTYLDFVSPCSSLCHYLVAWLRCERYFVVWVFNIFFYSAWAGGRRPTRNVYRWVIRSLICEIGILTKNDFGWNLKRWTSLKHWSHHPFATQSKGFDERFEEKATFWLWSYIYSILMRKGWRACQSNWTGTSEKSNAGFAIGGIRTNPQRSLNSVKACRCAEGGGEWGEGWGMTGLRVFCFLFFFFWKSFLLLRQQSNMWRGASIIGRKEENWKTGHPKFLGHAYH